MRASFVIAFHTARMDNLLQTLRFLERNHKNLIEECELLTICQDKTDLKVRSFQQHCHFNLEAECMHLPRLTNFGVNRAISNNIIVIESDRILPEGYFERMLDQLRPGVQISTKHMLKLTQPATDEEIITGHYQSKTEDRSETNELGFRNMWSGNTAFMKSDFYLAGQMDEAYRGYGWADNDMTNTMSAAGIQSIFLPDIELHLWHPGQTYGNGDQNAMFIDNGLYFCNKWKQPLPIMLRKRITQEKEIGFA